MIEPKQFFLSRAKTLDFLEKLETGNVAKSLYVPSGLATLEIKSLLESKGFLRGLTAYAAESKTGVAVFKDTVKDILVAPPFPIANGYFTEGYYGKPLRFLIETNRRIAVVLIRMGTYAIGLFDGEEMLKSKTGTGLVHARHKKGGSSQQRFSRHREKQIEYFLTRVSGHIREILEPYATSIKHVVYGGTKSTISALREQCDLLNRCSWDELPPLLDIPDPNRVVLEKSIRRLWCSRVTQIDEEL